MKYPYAKSIAAVGFMLCISGVHSSLAQTVAESPDPHSAETKAQRDVRMKWMREARFGMFIHWGLYAVPAGTWNGKQIGGIGEWIMNSAKIPVDDYAALASRFNPVQFNADTWAQLAKDAGMKYMVITSKHHDGFAMFHSLSDPYNIYDATPFKRDPIAELAAACKKRGIKFGVYYSQAQDWHHPGGAAYGGHWDKKQDGDLHEYVRKVAAPQVKELLTRYHPAVLWWDTPVDMSREDIRLLTEAFKDDLGLIANNRLGNGVPGDTETPEQFIPATGFKDRDWETCMTINDTWGYKSYDTNFKSTATLLHNLIDIASKGGNYLLNVGPDATGVIPAPEAQRLLEVGAWMKKNGASIYGTTASPYRRLPFNGRITVKKNTLYVNVFEWPEGPINLIGLKTEAISAHVLASGAALKLSRTPEGALEIARPSAEDISPLSTAIEIRLKGAPEVSAVDSRIMPGPGGVINLLAEDAVLDGQTIKLEGSNLGYWMNQNDMAHWAITVPQGGVRTYLATIDYSCENGSGGSEIEILVDGKSSGVKGTIAQTGSWQNYNKYTLTGTLNLSSGQHEVKIKPLTKPGLAVMNLKAITLKPTGK
jgi:alpha-L-fucosidase